MGYKLAGYDVLGGVEIDPKMMDIYRRNHNPKLSYLMGVREFFQKPDDSLPKELFNLDILDGSPPCSSFSMSGSRERAWGEKKKFREGQVDQVLDDLFFDFIDIAKKLQPKIVVAENVKGLIMGNARGYVKKIFSDLEKAGYECQLFLLNACRMGVPQRRERTFFIARRKDLSLPKMAIEFNEEPIASGIALKGRSTNGKPLTERVRPLWMACSRGKSLSTVHPKGSYFSWGKLDPRKVCGTITSGPATMHWDSPRMISDHETIALQSFPDDFDFMENEVRYICGMSVPPFMMQRVASQIYEQLLKPLKPAR